MSQVKKTEGGNGEPSAKKNKEDCSVTNNPVAREQFSICCRICHSVLNSEKLISPCLCKGSLAFVHLSCLERWLNQSGRDTCELCMFRFEAEQTRRYSVMQGLSIWYRHPRHRTQLKADLVIGIVLTGVTLGLCSICVGGMKYFVLEGYRVGISYIWTQGVICFFLSVIVVGYSTTMYLMFRDHLVPWHNWWNRCVNVRLILDMNVIPSFDPAVIPSPSNETLNVLSQQQLNDFKLTESDHDQDRKSSTVIIIPDISSTSFQRIHTNNSIPSVMSAVMSHILQNTARNPQQKISTDNVDTCCATTDGGKTTDDSTVCTFKHCNATSESTATLHVTSQSSVKEQSEEKTKK